MVFDKQVRKVCAHCLHAHDFSSTHDLCLRVGPVSPDHTCSRFQYDPLRRTPAKPARLLVPQDKDAFKL